MPLQMIMRILVVSLLLASCSSPKQVQTVATPAPAPPAAAEVEPAPSAEDTLQLRQQKAEDESTRRLNLAVEAANRGEFRVAIEHAKDATAMNRDNHYAWFVEGQLHNQVREYLAATEAFAEAVRIQPENSNYRFRLGRAHWFDKTTGKRDQAQLHLEKAVELEPTLFKAHYYLGLVYKSQGKPKQAAQAFTKSATLAPQFGPPLGALGKLYLKWRRPDEAIAVLAQAALRASEKDWQVDHYYHLALGYTMKNDPPRALWAYNKGLSLQPDDNQGLRQRGFLYAEEGDVVNAKKDLLTLVSQEVTSTFDRAKAYRWLRRPAFKRKRPRGKRLHATEPTLPVIGETLKLPPVPDFRVPVMVGDTHRVGELLVLGERYLGQEIKVRGRITWIYDCASAIRAQGMSKKDVKRLLKTEPERCLRPHLNLADTKNPKNREWIEVVEVPRKIRRDEQMALPQDIVDNWPEVPVLVLGSEVIVTGTWDTRSPRGFINSEGLLIYKSIEQLP